jgi:preprotein translocase subunit Sec61beta
MTTQIETATKMAIAMAASNVILSMMGPYVLDQAHVKGPVHAVISSHKRYIMVSSLVTAIAGFVGFFLSSKIKDVKISPSLVIMAIAVIWVGKHLTETPRIDE